MNEPKQAEITVESSNLTIEPTTIAEMESGDEPLSQSFLLGFVVEIVNQGTGKYTVAEAGKSDIIGMGDTVYGAFDDFVTQWGDSDE